MKNITLKLVVLGFVTMIGTSAVASGFRCQTTDGMSLKIFNHVNPNNGTRTPAAFVLSDERGTLLSAKGSDISKKNLRSSVQYIVEGNSRVNAEWVIASISFKEGSEDLDRGQTVRGTLTFVDEDGYRNTSSMLCARYLKR